jgi:hypothetical protein
MILRDLAARAQSGINSLHAHLRSYWNMFDYFFSFAIIAVFASLISRDVFPMGGGCRPLASLHGRNLLVASHADRASDHRAPRAL